MDPYFLNAVTSGLKDTITNLHKERLKSQADAEERAKSVYEALMKSGNSDAASYGFHKMMELANDPKGADEVTKLFQKEEKKPEFHKAKSVVKQIRDQAEASPNPDEPPASSGDPLAPAATPSTTPPPEAPPDMVQPSDLAFEQMQMGDRAPIPAPVGPPPPPPGAAVNPASSAAQNPSQQGSGLDLQPSAGKPMAGAQPGLTHKGPPPAAPEEMTPYEQYQRIAKENPHLSSASIMPLIQTTSRERVAGEGLSSREKVAANKLSADATKQQAAFGQQEKMEGIKQTGRMSLQEAKAATQKDMQKSGALSRREELQMRLKDADARQDKALAASVERQIRTIDASASKYNARELDTMDTINTNRVLYGNVAAAIKGAGLENENDAMDLAKARYDNLLYKAGVYDSFYSDLRQLDRAAAAYAIREIGGGRMTDSARKFLQEHLPNTAQDSPKQVYEKAMGMLKIMRVREDAIDTTHNKLKSKMHDAPPAAPSSLTGDVDEDVLKRLDKYK